MFGFSLDLLDQLTFYGSYHRDPVNKAIHLVCVPGIAWSALVWFAACGPLVEGAHLARWLAALGAPQMVAESAVPTPAMLITALYAAYYVALEPIAGTTWVACVGAPMCLTATAFQAWAAPSAWVYALAVHAFCWIAPDLPGTRRLRTKTPRAPGLSLPVPRPGAPVRVDGGDVRVRVQTGLHADLKRRVVKRVAAMEEADSKIHLNATGATKKRPRGIGRRTDPERWGMENERTGRPEERARRRDENEKKTKKRRDEDEDEGESA